MKKSKMILLFTVLAFALTFFAAMFVDSAVSNSAKVTYLAGKAYKSTKQTGPWTPIARNQSVSAGYYVKTDKDARVELTMPDNSKIRIAPLSILFLSSAKFSKGVRTYEASVAQGQVYTKAAPSSNKDDKFVVRSGGAVAGVRGTSFDTILLPDGGTRVKCYEGKVWVATWADYAQRYLSEKQEIPTSGSLDAPVVPGPGVVTEEEWVKIAGAMMSCTIGADGKISEPQPFTDSQNSDWEEWNRDRDAGR